MIQTSIYELLRSWTGSFITYMTIKISIFAVRSKVNRSFYRISLRNKKKKKKKKRCDHQIHSSRTAADGDWETITKKDAGSPRPIITAGHQTRHRRRFHASFSVSKWKICDCLRRKPSNKVSKNGISLQFTVNFNGLHNMWLVHHQRRHPLTKTFFFCFPPFLRVASFELDWCTRSFYRNAFIEHSRSKPSANSCDAILIIYWSPA